MNLKDLQGAIQDMLTVHGAELDDLIYIEQKDGNYKLLNGLEWKDGKIIID